MVNIYSVSITQHDCPHAFVTSRIPGLTIFVMNTMDSGRKYQKTLSLFYAKSSAELQETVKLMQTYDGLRDLEVLGMGSNTMSLLYRFPKTSAYRWVSEVGFRMHPIVVRNGEEKWFFVSQKQQKVSQIEKDLSDGNTSILHARKLTTANFINEYSSLFSDVWKIRLESLAGEGVVNLLMQALNFGFYDWPRKSSLSELSQTVKMPRSTLTYRLRKIEKIIIQDIGK